MQDVKLEENVMVPMSDGIKLAVDLYKPAKQGKFPAIVAMSPYGKEYQRWPGGFAPFVEAGNINYFVIRDYVYVVADSRGSFPSEGKWNFFDKKEQRDGAELIEWVAHQSWCDGNVAMMGESYYSLIQYLVAAQQPPSLKTIVPFDGMTDLYRDWAYQGGLWTIGFMSRWAVNTCRRCFPPEGTANTGKWEPTIEAPMDNVLNSTDGPYYWERSVCTRFDKIKVPIYHIVCPYNFLHYRGQLRAYTEINTPKKLLVAPGLPWAFNYSDEACNEILRWLDYWLKGKDTGIMKDPPVTIFVAGDDKWRYENEYPLARTNWTKLYLRSGEGKDAGEPPYGLLSGDMPGDESSDTFSYPQSQRKIEANLPALGYISAPFKEDMDVIGPASLTLYASSSAVDTAWMIKIDDVAPDGSPTLVSKGWLKASHRELDEKKSTIGQPYHTHTNPTLVEPGKIYRYEIEIWSMFRTFKAGHRLKLRVASSDSHFWDFDYFHSPVDLLINNIVYHNKNYPSHVSLPVIPRDSSGNRGVPKIHYIPPSGVR